MLADGPQPCPFERLVQNCWPVADWSDRTVAVAVSGGADSVALLWALARLRAAGRGRLVVAHFNHQLRGRESDVDAAFVVELARRLGLGVELGAADEDPIDKPAQDGGRHRSEADARTARYRFLLGAAERVGARYLATAHTADDQAETILHRLIRGAGLEGLSGMSRSRVLSPAVTLMRPMLSIRRSEVESYLRSLGQDWRDDATNRETRFTRNRIRHELLPRLAADYNPAIVEALLRLGQQASAAGEIVRSAARRLLDRANFAPGGDVRLSIVGLDNEPRHLIRELMVLIWRQREWPLQDMGFDEWDRLASLAVGPPDRRLSEVTSLDPSADPQSECSITLPAAIRAVRRNNEIILSRLAR